MSTKRVEPSRAQRMFAPLQSGVEKVVADKLSYRETGRQFPRLLEERRAAGRVRVDVRYITIAESIRRISGVIDGKGRVECVETLTDFTGQVCIRRNKDRCSHTHVCTRFEELFWFHMKLWRHFHVHLH